MFYIWRKLKRQVTAESSEDFRVISLNSVANVLNNTGGELQEHQDLGTTNEESQSLSKDSLGPISSAFAEVVVWPTE